MKLGLNSADEGSNTTKQRVKARHTPRGYEFCTNEYSIGPFSQKEMETGRPLIGLR